MENYRNDLETLKPYLPHGEFSALAHYVAPGAEERDGIGAMVRDWNTKIKAMPKIYEQEKAGPNAIVHLHYFFGGSDWYITEIDKDGPQAGAAFGFAILNGDLEMAELGYISIEELTENSVELDLYWTPRPLGEIKRELGL